MTTAARLEAVRSCLLCGDVSSTPFSRKHPGLRQCAGCGLVTWEQLPSKKDIVDLYNGQIYSSLEYYRRSQDADLRTFKNVMPRISARTPPGRLLDVGCASGAFMRAAKEIGWETEGIDLNRTAVEFCRSNLGFPVSCVELTERTYPASSFDLVHLGDVLEHVTDPLGLMKIIFQILRPSGWVVISTPNIDSWAARVFQIKPREHLYYFNSRTLSRLLQQSGYDNVSIKTHDRYRSLTALADGSTFIHWPWTRRGLAVCNKVLSDSFSIRFPFRENLLAFAQKPAS